MERESFSSPEIANILNGSFIPIKVDREERPDIDAIYMNYVQAITGSGGWPLNVFLTPDLEPVFGGTYWSGPNNSMVAVGTVSFLDILKKMTEVWTHQESRCRESAKEITKQLREFAEEGVHSHPMGEKDEGDGLELELLEEAYQHFVKKFDTINGGFSVAPKFALPVNLRFLLRLHQGPDIVKHMLGVEECANATMMAVNTLRKMARGGIRDQVGYGFARYSVTTDWGLPHFEKMLYDQAQLLNVYLDAFLITGDLEMLGVVYDVVTYLTSSPIAAPCGGFYSAEDADSYPTKTDTEKREGAYYVWSLKTLYAVLGDCNGDICARFYGVTADGNVARENDPQDEFISQNVLSIKTTPSALAKELGMAETEIIEILKVGRRKLREYRENERPRPTLDDKIIVAWNGLAISALARTSAALDGVDLDKAKECLTAAEKAVAFVKKELFDEESSTLWHIYREGRGDTPGFCDDYAFLIQGLIDLYETTWNEEYLQFADRLQSRLLVPSAFIWYQLVVICSTKTYPPRAESQIYRFISPPATGFYTTPSPPPSSLLLRLKTGMDSTEPSSNNVSASNLHRLSSLLTDENYARLARQTVQAFEAEVEQFPWCFVGMLDSVVWERCGGKGIVVVGAESEDVAEKVKGLRRQLGVGRTVLGLGLGKGEWIRGRNELLKSIDLTQPKIYVCEGGVCKEGL